MEPLNAKYGVKQSPEFISTLTAAQKREYLRMLIKRWPKARCLVHFTENKPGKCRAQGCPNVTFWDGSRGYRVFCSRDCANKQPRTNGSKTIKCRLKALAKKYATKRKYDYFDFSKSERSILRKSVKDVGRFRKDLLPLLEKKDRGLLKKVVNFRDFHNWACTLKVLIDGVTPVCPQCEARIEPGQSKYAAHCGSSCAALNPRVESKKDATFKRKYGLSRNDRLVQSALSYKEKSVVIRGKTFRVQGYEGRAIKWLVDTKRAKVENILPFKGNFPPVMYDFGGKECKHYPDFVVRKLDGTYIFVEAKGIYTGFGKCRDRDFWEMLKSKRQGALNLGYTYRVIFVPRDNDNIRVVPSRLFTATREEAVTFLS